MKNIILCLALSLLNAGAFAGGFGELLDLQAARTPAFELPEAAPAAVKQYDYNFRCIAGPSTPQYTAPYCYLYTAKGQQACQNADCSWSFAGTPIPSFHCAAGSFTPEHVKPFCHIYTPQGQQACVNAGCGWTFGTKSARLNNQQNTALRKIRMNPGAADQVLFAQLGAEPAMDIAVKELEAGGFPVMPLVGLVGNDDNRTVAYDATGKDAAAEAIGLAKYYFVTEVLVSKKVHDTLFSMPR